MNRLLWANPVLQRELQERVLSRRTAVIITLWVGVLCLITGLYYASEATSSFGGGFGNDILRLANVGQNMFDWLLFFMIGLVLFLVPGVTAASIAGERERQTLLPMQVTLLRPIDIVVGKIAASLVFVLLLIAVTLPVMAFSYVIGGVTIGEVFASLAMLIFSATAIACLTVACSAVVRRVPAAIVTAYGLVLVLSVGSLAAYGVASVVDENRGIDQDRPPLTMLAVNPVLALAEVSDTAVTNDFFFRGTETPMGALRELIDDHRRRANVDLGGGRFGPFPGDVIVEPAIELPVPIPAPMPTPTPEPPGEGALPDDALQDAEAVLEAAAEPDVVIEAPPIDPALLDRIDVAEIAVLEDDFFAFGQPNVRAGDDGLSFVMQYLLVMTALSAIAVWIATRRVRAPAEVER